MRFITTLFMLSFSISAFAVGPRYTENFSGGLSGWYAANPSDPWVVTSGYLANTTTPGGAQSSIALYDATGNTKWTDDFAYTLRGYADYPGTGNWAGVVFGYKSAGNYYDVLANTSGSVTVRRFVNGSVAWTQAGTVAAFAPDTFFDWRITLLAGKVAVNINGASTSFVVGGQSVTSVALPAVESGQVGVVTRGNFGRFDDISIVNRFFSTAFTGATMQPPRPKLGGSSCTTTCYQDITGPEWPIRIWDLEGMFQLLADVNVVHTPGSPNSIDQYFANQIQSVIGHAGTNTAALSQRILQRGGSHMQDPYILRASDEVPDATQGDFYVRFWIKLQPDLVEKLPDGWRMFFQWKDGSDYRMSLNMNTTSNHSPNGIPVWELVGDNQATSQTKKVYFDTFRAPTSPGEVPVDRWFKFEIYQRRNPADLSDFRVWVAIDGQTLFNQVGPHDGLAGHFAYAGPYTKITRIMLPQLYWGTYPEGDIDTPVYQWIDDIEIWDGFPPGASAH